LEIEELILMLPAIMPAPSGANAMGVPRPESETAGKTAGMPAKGARYGFIDLLRGIALVVMIETHIVNSYLPDASRHNPFFFWLTFLNGLVAPTFLFATGFSIMLLGSRQWEEWLRFSLPFWKQMRRLGFIMLVAYFAHLHDYKLSRYLHPSSNAWAETLQVDILQCIVVSLLAIHLLIFLLRKREVFAWCAGALAVIVAFLTPWMWSIDFIGKIPLALALFLNPHHISLFPLFPWTCFVLAGSCLSYFFLKAVEQKRDESTMKYVMGAGCALIAGCLLLRQVPFTLPGHVNFFTTSPLYVFVRLGCVMIICSLLYMLEKKLGWRPRPLLTAGQESLLVYGAHLWFIFGILRGKYLGSILGKEAGYLWCMAVSVAVIILMLWLAKQWHSLKANHPRLVRLAQAAAIVIITAVFLLR
jgi:uncharacterized membrane protein